MKRYAAFAVTTALLVVVAFLYSPICSVADGAGLDATIDDFLVNDDEVGGCSQNDPMVAMNSSGSAVVVWRDSRYGLGLIFARRYDSDLNPVGASFRVSDDLPYATYWPSIDMNSQGSFAVVWIREGDENFDRKVYSQLFDSHGRSIGSNIEVSDPLDPQPSYPSVAIKEDGSFAVCWVEQYKNNTDDLVARVMNADGQPAGPVFQISDPSGNAVQRAPRVATDASGNFIVTWTESVGGEVLVSTFDATGTIVSEPTAVNHANPDMRALTPTIATAPSGCFVVTWLVTDDSKNEYFPFMKLCDAMGAPLTEDTPVCPGPFSILSYPVEIAMEESGAFMLMWSEKRNGNYDVFMREYDADGNPLGIDQAVSGADGPDSQTDAAGASDGNSQRIIVWEDSRDYYRDIYGQVYSGDVTELGNGVRINDDFASGSQHTPGIACNESGQFSIVWLDRRDQDRALYLQVFDASGNPVSENWIVSSSDIHGSLYPAVAMDAAGRTVAVWNDSGDVRTQYFDQEGIPTGAAFSVNDTAYAGLNMTVAMNDSGKSVIAWRTGGTPWQPTHGIYVRRCDEAGNPIGPSFMANEYLDGAEYSPSAAICHHGAFVVGWHCDRDDDSSGIYVQLFDSTGVPLGSNILVGTTPINIPYHDPFVCMDSSGAFVVAWTDVGSDGKYTLYAQRYDPLANPIGPPIIVSDDPDLTRYAAPRIACDRHGNFVVVWPNRPGSERNIYAQIFDSDGNPQGSSFIVTNPAGLPFRQEDPVVAANGSSILFAWEDTRGARGYDIYAKVCDWSVGLAVCGDANGSGEVDLDDVVSLIDHIFNGIQMRGLPQAADADSSGNIDIDDVVYLINYMFTGGNAPCDIDGDGVSEY